MPDNAQTASPGSPNSTGAPQTSGKGGGGGSLPYSQYPMTPYWMSSAGRPEASMGPMSGQSNVSPQRPAALTPAMDSMGQPSGVSPSGQGAGRFLGSGATGSETTLTNLMGGRGGLTPTPTPVTMATRAPAAFRPSVTPSIYEQWLAYNAEKKAIMNRVPGDSGSGDFGASVGWGNQGLQGAGG